jgi:hypothetical protein
VKLEDKLKVEFFEVWKFEIDRSSKEGGSFEWNLMTLDGIEDVGSEARTSSEACRRLKKAQQSSKVSAKTFHRLEKTQNNSACYLKPSVTSFCHFH